MSAEELSKQWRNSNEPYLGFRRWIVALSLVNITSMGMITLFQTGIIPRLPEAKLPLFDSDRIVSSPEAYALLDTPDAVLGLGSYATTLGLAAFSGASRYRDRPWLPIMLSAKALADSAMALKLLGHEITRFKSVCSWCMVAAASTLAIVALATREMTDALGRMRTDRPKAAGK